MTRRSLASGSREFPAVNVVPETGLVSAPKSSYEIFSPAAFLRFVSPPSLSSGNKTIRSISSTQGSAEAPSSAASAALVSPPSRFSALVSPKSRPNSRLASPANLRVNVHGCESSHVSINVVPLQQQLKFTCPNRCRPAPTTAHPIFLVYLLTTILKDLHLRRILGRKEREEGRTSTRMSFSAFLRRFADGFSPEGSCSTWWSWSSIMFGNNVQLCRWTCVTLASLLRSGRPLAAGRTDRPARTCAKIISPPSPAP